MKSFFNWLINERLIDVNPVNNSKQFKTKTTYIETISEKDLDKIRSACTNLRERALIEVLYSTGCTLNELTNLKKDKID